MDHVLEIKLIFANAESSRANIIHKMRQSYNNRGGSPIQILEIAQWNSLKRVGVVENER